MKHTELSHIAMYRDLLEYVSLKAGVLYYLLVKNVLSSESSSSLYTPKKIIQRPDVSQGTVKNKVDCLGS